jgi:hypothetical protein
MASGPLLACCYAASTGRIISHAVHLQSVHVQGRERAFQRASCQRSGQLEPSVGGDGVQELGAQRVGAPVVWQLLRARPPCSPSLPLCATGQACERLSVLPWTRVRPAGRARVTARGHAALAPAKATSALPCINTSSTACNNSVTLSLPCPDVVTTPQCALSGGAQRRVRPHHAPHDPCEPGVLRTAAAPRRRAPANRSAQYPNPPSVRQQAEMHGHTMTLRGRASRLKHVLALGRRSTSRAPTAANGDASQGTRWMVSGGARCRKPPNGDRLTDVTKRSSRPRSSALMAATTCRRGCFWVWPGLSKPPTSSCAQCAQRVPYGAGAPARTGARWARRASSLRGERAGAARARGRACQNRRTAGEAGE